MPRARFFRLILIVLFTLAGVSILQAPAIAAMEYSVTDIGSLAGYGDGQFDELVAISPAAISGDGTVVANATSGVSDGCCDSFTPLQGSWAVPFRSKNGKVRRIGRERDYSQVADINNSGEIVGFATKHDHTLWEGDAVVWREGNARALPSLGGDFGFAYGINDAGDIVGTSRLATGAPQQHAALWTGGQVFDLGTLGGDSSVAYDINNSGVIAGAAVKTAVRYRPAIWRNGEIHELPLPAYWVAGEALAINDNGIVVGGGYREFSEAPLRWIDGNVEQLPGFAERATGAAGDINTAGVIVGKVYRQEKGYAGYVAVRWDESGMVDLNDLIPANSGYRLVDAVSINDSGQILATAIAADGSRHGLVLSPNRASAGNVANLAWAITGREARRSF